MIALAAAVLRQWRLAAFFVFVLALESAVYRATTLVVHRDRPAVPRLEQLPANASYSSGHTAASIAVYCGTRAAAHLADREPRRRASRSGRSRSAIPIYVAFARMYRGMHHPLDVLGGVPRRDRRARRARLRLPRRRSCGRRRVSSRRGGDGMPKVAVIAHAGKTFGGGLLELRRVLEEHGVADPFWAEVPKSRKAPKQVERALDAGAELIFVWGGDGIVQRCLDAVAGTDVRRRDRPGGHREPVRLEPRHPAGHRARGRDRAARRAAQARRRPLQRRALRRHGRSRLRRRDDPRRGRRRSRTASGAPPTSGPARRTCAPSRSRRRSPSTAQPWYAGKASCILVGNVGHLFAGVEAFEDASPDDGRLERRRRHRGRHRADWARMLARTAVGHAPSVAVRPRDDGAAGSRSSSTARCSTSSTAATARR